MKNWWLDWTWLQTPVLNEPNQTPLTNFKILNNSNWIRNLAQKAISTALAHNVALHIPAIFMLIVFSYCVSVTRYFYHTIVYPEVSTIYCMILNKIYTELRKFSILWNQDDMTPNAHSRWKFMTCLRRLRPFHIKHVEGGGPILLVFLLVADQKGVRLSDSQGPQTQRGPKIRGTMSLQSKQDWVHSEVC